MLVLLSPWAQPFDKLKMYPPGRAEGWISVKRVVIVVVVASIVLAMACLGTGGCAVPGGSGTSTSGSEAGNSSTSQPGSTDQSTTTALSTTTAQPSTTAQPTTSVQSTTTARPSTTTQPPTTVPPTTTTPQTTALTSTSTTARPAKDYSRVPTDEKVVALTFDAAYDPVPLKDILAALEGAGADATFFLTGEFVEDFPTWTKAIIAAGYPIGNHSYSHPDFTELSNKAIQSQLKRMASALAKVGGDDPKPLFRAPYGALSKRVLSVLGGEGYVSVYWTIDTLDWKPERTAEQIKATVLSKLKPGAIILMHVGSKQTAGLLPDLLAEIEARGYGFVNLRDALPEAAG
jgi:peptidoglycan/xylan/chitin deacetylase (PgdA/CDA1 family)